MLDPGDLHKLLRAGAETRESEIDCDECFEQMDPFAEIEFSGSDAATAMPLVHDHLRLCEDCREKYETLLIGMRIPAASRGNLEVRTLMHDEPSACQQQKS